MQQSGRIRIARGNDRELLIVSDRRLVGIILSSLAAQSKNSEMEMPMKKASTKLVLFALGAACLSAVMNLPASADDNTPVTGGNGNCSTARDDAPNKHCLTKPKEGEKVGFDQFADEQAKLNAGRIKSTTWSASGTDRNGHPYEGNRYSDGSGDFRDTDPRTGMTSYTLRSANGTVSTFTSRSTGGGKGGTSAR